MPQYLLNEEIAETAAVMGENMVAEPATISPNSSVNSDDAFLTDVHQNFPNSSQNVVKGNTSTSSVHLDTISWILSSYTGNILQAYNISVKLELRLSIYFTSARSFLIS